jgi:hypothetical protein
MRKRWLAGLTLALLWAAPLWAAVKLKVPERVTGEPGAFLVVKADTDGTACRWLALDAGLNVFPPDMLTDKRATVVTAHRAGRYRLLCYTAVGNEPSEPALCLIVVGEPGPEPGPGPGPGPGPEPPAPTDPLTKALQAAYDADAGPARYLAKGPPEPAARRGAPAPAAGYQQGAERGPRHQAGCRARRGHAEEGGGSVWQDRGGAGGDEVTDLHTVVTIVSAFANLALAAALTALTVVMLVVFYPRTPGSDKGE